MTVLNPAPLNAQFVTQQLVGSNGTDDTATINAALTAGGTIRGRIGQTYLISAPLVIPSNTKLDMTGCTIAFTTTSIRVNMLQNSVVAPATTATDVATTAGSSVVTSPTLAAAAVVGQALAVVGAGPPGGNGGGAIWLYGQVLSIAGNNITLTGNLNGVAATTTLAGATGYLFNRDSNITVVGGTWNAGVNWNTLGNRQTFNSHQLRFRRVDGLTVKDATVQLSGFPLGGGWVFGIAPGDCTNFLVENCTGVGSSTVFQGDGPLSRGIVRDIRGQTQDDMVAFGAVGFQGNDVEGDVTEVEVNGVQSNNCWTAVKFFAGQGANGVQRIVNGSVRAVKGNTQNAAVNIVDYAGAGTGPINVLCDDITAVPGTGQQSVLNSATYGQVAQLNAVFFPPSDAGLLLSSTDPQQCSSNFQPSTTAGFIYLAKLWVPSPVTIANLLIHVHTAGGTLTAGQNFAGIYDSNGNLVAQTADQSAVWNTTGLKTMALTAQGAFTLNLKGGAGAFYWAAVLSKGTTAAAFKATTSTGLPANPGRGSPYAATVPGAQHRLGYESVGGRSTLVTLNAKTITDNGFYQTIWFGVT